VWKIWRQYLVFESDLNYLELNDEHLESM
jgi:hypothetical protein